jgi:MinD-like ATPase involved in chromosome partitioning or flagellar assembly
VSVVALVSAKGSPGVTTLAHRLGDVLARRERQARRSPRPVVVVEADLAGGDLAARRGLAGAPGLASLALSARRAIGPDTVLAHCQQLGAIGVLVGVAGSRQGLVVAPVLPRILDSLAEVDAIVLLDIGRLGPPLIEDPALLRQADTVCLVTRTTAECAVHARSAVDALRSSAVEAELVLVGRSEYPAGAIASAIGAPVLATIADSPAEAAADPRRPLRGRRGELARSVEAFADILTTRSGDPCAAVADAEPAVAPPVTMAALPGMVADPVEPQPQVVAIRSPRRTALAATTVAATSPASSA